MSEQKYKIVDYVEFNRLMDEFVKHITRLKEKSSNYDFTHIYGPPRGAWPMVTHLSHHLNLTVITENNFHGHDTNNMNLLIVDDISDTGQTLNMITNKLLAMADMTPTLNWKTCCLYFKESTKFVPEIFSEQIYDDVWVVFPWEKCDDANKECIDFKQRRQIQTDL